MIIWSIARTTFGDAMRKKVLQVFLVVAIGLIVISLSFSQTLSFSTREGASTDLMLIKSFGLGLMALAGWLITLVMGVQIIPQEIERRTIYTILAKPVKRYEFIVGKYLGALMTLGVNVLLMGLVFVLVVFLKAKGVEMTTASAASGIKEAAVRVNAFDMNVVWGILMIYMQFVVLSSVVLFFSVFLSPIVNFFMGLGVYLVGIMAPMTETMAKSESANAIIKGFYTAVHAIIPNFDKFNVTNALLHPEAHISNMGAYFGKVAMYGAIYALIMMLAAIIAFDKREV